VAISKLGEGGGKEKESSANFWGKEGLTPSSRERGKRGETLRTLEGGKEKN